MSFNRDNAVSYALDHAYNPNNSVYPNFGGNDCTNFVSQCWKEAGIPTSLYWYCESRYVYAKAWINVEEFATYMVNNGYSYVSYDSNDAKLGDVIQFHNGTEWHHSVIVTAIDSAGKLYYSAHSDPQRDKDLSAVYPSSGEQIRFLCVYDS